MASDRDAVYDDDVDIKAKELRPVVTWGVNPGQSVAVDGRVPSGREPGLDQDAVADALSYMGLEPGQKIAGMKVDVAFIGSCTNSRLSDLREAARIVKGHHIAPHVKGLVVPGSVAVRKAAEREGLDEIFRTAGFEWRGAGCSMCLGMNPDRLEGSQVCASSSNRNFKGRQGSPTGRTLLMSPAMVAAAAIAGAVTDVREIER
jgi:3-isopropylmalate/(R)-2-methylmalate dehydratase large subunit